MDYSYQCPTCKGKGCYDEIVCPHCHGYGHCLTGDGKQLIEFLGSRGVAFPMSPEAEDELRGSIESDNHYL